MQALVLFLFYLSRISASCVTFQEVIAAPSNFTCSRHDIVGVNSSICTLCQRTCLDSIPASDCVTILGGECPVDMPTPGSYCMTTNTCAFEPYCGPVFFEGGREICMFLAFAECVNNEWQVAMASAPTRNPTCNEIKLSYIQQSCCTNPNNPFDLSVL